MTATEGDTVLSAIVLAMRRQREADAAQRAAEIETRAAVEVARSYGVTWEMIGDVLGISKQAAQQRFGRREPAARG